MRFRIILILFAIAAMSSIYYLSLPENNGRNDQSQVVAHDENSTSPESNATAEEGADRQATSDDGRSEPKAVAGNDQEKEQPSKALQEDSQASEGANSGADSADWHQGVSRDIENTVVEEFSNKGYLMDMHCRDDYCDANVLFAGDDPMGSVERFQNKLNEEAEAIGPEADRPALIRSVSSGANGVEVDVRIQQDTSMPEPSAEQVREAYQEFLQRNPDLIQGSDRGR